MRLTDVITNSLDLKADPIGFLQSGTFPQVYICRAVTFTRVGWVFQEKLDIRSVMDFSENPDFPAPSNGWKCSSCRTIFFGSDTDDLKHECTDPK